MEITGSILSLYKLTHRKVRADRKFTRRAENRIQISDAYFSARSSAPGMISWAT